MRNLIALVFHSGITWPGIWLRRKSSYRLCIQCCELWFVIWRFIYQKKAHEFKNSKTCISGILYELGRSNGHLLFWVVEMTISHEIHANRSCDTSNLTWWAQNFKKIILVKNRTQRDFQRWKSVFWKKFQKILMTSKWSFLIKYIEILSFWFDLYRKNPKT